MFSRRRLCLIALTAPLFSSCSSTKLGELLGNGLGHPSDLELERIFYTKRNHFEELIDMFEVDSKVALIDFNYTLLRGDPNHSAKDIGFTEARWDQYRDLFSQLKLKEGIARPGNSKMILMTTSLVSITIGGSSKGYAYSKVPVEPLFNSLNSYPSEPDAKGYEYAYKRLEGNWYLYLH